MDPDHRGGMWYSCSLFLSTPQTRILYTLISTLFQCKPLCTKKFLWWCLGAARIYEYRDTNLEWSLILLIWQSNSSRFNPGSSQLWSLGQIYNTRYVFPHAELGLNLIRKWLVTTIMFMPLLYPYFALWVIIVVHSVDRWVKLMRSFPIEAYVAPWSNTKVSQQWKNLLDNINLIFPCSGISLINN